MRRATRTIQRLLPLLLLTVALVAQAPVPTTSTVRLRGRVLDAAGAPFATASVLVGAATELTTEDALAAPTARCAADGGFAVEVAGPAAELSVLVVAPGKVGYWIRGRALDESRRPPAPAAIDLGEVRLPDGVNLRGRVRDAEGKPIVGARIEAIDHLTTYPWMQSSFASLARSGDDGTFTLRGVFAAAMQVEFAADGYYSRKLDDVGLDAPLDVRLVSSGFVTGTFVDADGVPLDGWSAITPEFAGSRGARVAVRGGHFRLGIEARCRFKVWATSERGNAQSQLLAGPAADLVMRVPPAAQRGFTVRAVDAQSGEPVAPIRAGVVWFGGAINGYPIEMLANSLRDSNTAGVVGLDGSIGMAGLLYVTAAGHAPLLVEGIEATATERVVELERGGLIKGVVLDAEHKPLAGVTVGCDDARLVALRDYHPGNVLSWSAVSGADGAFAIRGVGPADWVVKAQHPGGTVTATVHVVLQAAEERHGVQLAMPVGATVAGRLVGAAVPPGWRQALDVDGDKSRAGGALAEMPDGWNVAGSLPIGADGAFRFEHRDSRENRLVLVVPLAPRHGAALQIQLTRIPLRSPDIDLVPHLPGVVRGTVTCRGAAIPKARLAVLTISLDEGGAGFAGSSEQLLLRHWCLVANDGSFAVPVAPGAHRVQVVDVVTGVVLYELPEAVPVGAGQSRTVALPVAVVAGEARFTMPGEGPMYVEHVELAPLRAGSDRWELTPFGGGTYGSSGIYLDGTVDRVPFFAPPGSIKLEVHSGATGLDHGGISFSGQPRASVTVDAEPGKPLRVELELPPPPDLGG